MVAALLVGLITAMEDEPDTGGLSATAGKKQVTVSTVSASYEKVMRLTFDIRFRYEPVDSTDPLCPHHESVRFPNG